MAKPKTVKSDVKTKVESPYVISFSVGGDTYTAEGATILEALQKIKPKKYLGICKVEAMRDGKKSRVPLKLVPITMRRIFEKPLELELLAKRLTVLL